MEMSAALSRGWVEYVVGDVVYGMWVNGPDRESKLRDAMARIPANGYILSVLEEPTQFQLDALTPKLDGKELFIPYWLLLLGIVGIPLLWALWWSI